MKKERFQSGSGLLVLVSSGFVLMFLATYMEHRLPSSKNMSLAVLCALGTIAVVLWNKEDTYLEITDSRLLTNSGYHDFGDDIIDIRDIKYIYRVPQFPLAWFGGSLMVIYHTDEKVGIRHSALRETNYPEDTLKKFLLRIKEIKSTIEFDAEYLQILEDKRSFRESSDNTVAIVEQRLRDKGEKWDKVGMLHKFLGKF